MSLDQEHLLGAENQVLSLRQGDFIRRFNELNMIMVSMPDLYEAGKSADDSLIESLRKDLKESWIISSTRIQYEKDSLEAAIIHYFNSTVIAPNEKKVIIPIYNGTVLDSILPAEHGLAFLQALFNTDDNAEEIKNTLYRLSGKPSNKTKVWTPDQNSRKNNPERAAGLYYSDSDLRVSGDYYLDDSGRSRRVLENPAGVALKNRVLHAGKELELPFELDSGIDKKSHCVYFSNIQHVSDFAKYSGLFCFYKNRFVISMTAPPSDDYSDWGKKISSVLAQGISTKEKLGKIDKQFSPIYAHLLKYEQRDNSFVSVDDVESFGKPRITEGARE